MTQAGDEEEQDRKRTRHIDEPLGARLRAMREDRGMTQADMGQKLGISGNQWGRHEGGENRVPAARLWQFCSAMNVEVAEIYEGLPAHIALQQRHLEWRRSLRRPLQGRLRWGAPSFNA